MWPWRWVQQALLGHWRRHPIQALAWLGGLLLATALWSGVQALNQQARQSYDRAAGLLQGQAQPSIEARTGQQLTRAEFTTLRQRGWPVSPLLEGRIEVQNAAQEWVWLNLLGIDPITLSGSAQPSQILTQQSNGVLSFMVPPGQALVGPDTLRRLGLSGTAQIKLNTGEQLPPLVVSDAIPPGVVIVDIGQAVHLLQQPDSLTRLLLPEASPLLWQPLPTEVASVLRWQAGQTEADLSRLSDSFHLNLSALGLLAFTVGLLIVYSATGLAFQQRRALFRTLRSCGVSQRLLLSSLAIEMTVMALLAGGLGLMLGYWVAGLLLPGMAVSLRGLFGAPVGEVLSLDLRWWLSGALMSLLGAWVAAAGHLWETARLPLLAGPDAWRARQLDTLRWQWRLGLALWVLAAALLMWSEGLVLAFVALALVLLGAALLLPALLQGVVALGTAWARQPLTRWFWAETRQQLSGLSLALMALLLALSTNIGVGGMVDSFRITFTGWLEQRLAAEVYVNVPEPAEAEAIGQWLEHQPEITAVLPTAQVVIRYRDWPLELFGVSDHATFRESWPTLQTLPDSWPLLARGEAAWVSEQWQRVHQVELGERIVLPGEQPWSVLIAGVYADYGNPRPQMLVAAPTLLAWYPGELRQGFAVRSSPSSAAGIVQRAQAELGLSRSQVIDQATVKTFSETVFAQTFAATGALSLLTLGVAGLALLASLLTLAQSRLALLAPLWAQGVPRHQLIILEALRTLLLALLTVLFAIPLGLALAWLLVVVINVEAFGWRLPLYHFPEQWLMLGGLSLLSAALAMAWPVWQLFRQPPTQWLKIFALQEGR